MGFPASYPVGQQAAVTLISAASGILSVAGSAVIVYTLCRRDGEGRRQRLQHVDRRYLLGLCISDIINSFVFIFWSLPLPKDSPNVWGARGNKASCDFQGVMNQLGQMGSWYQGALSHYFYVSICHGVSRQDISKKYERKWNAVAIGFPILTGVILGLALDSFAYTSNGCWFFPSPFGCHRDSDVRCERGERGIMFAWLTMGIPLLLIQGLIGFHMFKVYRYVQAMCDRAGKRIFQFDTRSSERSSASNEIEATSIRSTAENSNKSQQAEKSKSDTTARPISWSDFEERKRQAGIQAILYVLAYFITHAWAFFVYHCDVFGVGTPFVLQFINQCSWPLQGFLNVFIFLRPRIGRIRQQLPEVSYWRAAYLATFQFEEIVPHREERVAREGITQIFNRNQQSSSKFQKSTSIPASRKADST